MVNSCVLVFLEQPTACRACGSEDFDPEDDCEDCGNPRVPQCLHCGSINLDLDDADLHCLDCEKSQLQCDGCNRLDAEECIECGENWCLDCWGSETHGEFCMRAPTRERLWKDAREILASTQDADDTLAGALLLASANLGANADRCAKFLGVSRKRVRWMAQNLRDNGVWVDHHVHANWEDEKTGAVEFVIDVLVALGEAERCEDGMVKYVP